MDAPTLRPPSIRIRTQPIVRSLWVAFATVLGGWLTFLLLLHNDGHELALKLARVFDVDSEIALPVWLSTVMLSIGAGCAALVAWLERAMLGRWWRHWAALAIGFLALSIDETAALHERVGNALADALGVFAVPTFTWVLPFSVLVLGTGCAFLPFLRSLPRIDATRLLVAGAVYVGGALGGELIGGVWTNLNGAESLGTLGYHLIVTLEETLELVGAILFVRAALLYVDRRYGGLTIESA